MAKQESLERLIHIANLIKNNPVSFNEISDYLIEQGRLNEKSFEISKRTFQRDLNLIRTLYKIDIDYDFSQKKYYFVGEEVPDSNVRMLEAFNMFNALNTAEGISEYIKFEKRKPLGIDNLYGILHSIKNRYQIKFLYHKYIEDIYSNRKIEPYALKEFENRWYVIGKDTETDLIKSFGLERLTQFEITKKTFPKYTFNCEKYFEHCFGIVIPEIVSEPENIILSVDPLKWKYLKSLPIHESQKCIDEKEKEVQISLKLYITYDFIIELLKHGKQIRVIQPKILDEKLKENRYIGYTEEKD